MSILDSGELSLIRRGETPLMPRYPLDGPGSCQQLGKEKGSVRKGSGMQPVSVLLIDDHPIFLEGLRRILEAQDDLRVVGEADTMAGAVEQVRQQQPAVALLDLGLKDGSGLDALPRLLEASPAT